MRNTYRKIKVTAGRFLRDGHGGATTIVAVGVTVMTLGGAALIIDHNHLVAQRDILKSAADAASMAATLELNQLPDTLTEDQVRDRVLAAAHKYGVLNVLGNIADPDLTADDVEVTFDIDRGLRIVSSLIEARTGSTLASGWLYGYFGPGAISVRSGVEAVETTVELVLAIDLSESMRRNLDGDSVGYTHPDSRLVHREERRQANGRNTPAGRDVEHRRVDPPLGLRGPPDPGCASDLARQRMGGIPAEPALRSLV